jgi:MFS family permease
LYLDRYALGIASEKMRVDLNMTQTQVSWSFFAFFFAYALCQVPAGWLSDRFGPRVMLTVYILGWSLFTGLLGFTTQVGILLLLRFLCGASQAGAYPVCSGMVRHWFPVARRGLASSIVAMGGRSGAVLASSLTGTLIAAFAGGWRPVLIVYGLVGILVAFVFAWFCRDTPRDHPLCNEVERNLISDHTHVVSATIPAAKANGESGIDGSLETDNPYAYGIIEADKTSGSVKTDEPGNESQRFPMIPILTSISLWGNSLTQFLTNIGWLFVVTWLPRYLGDVHKVPLLEQGVMTAIPTAAGIVGMLCGGWWTDVAVHRFGLKWGRRLPVVATRFMAATGYAVCLTLGLLFLPDPDSRWLPWAIIAGLSFATFSGDLGVPAVWAYSQDVGGKYTAAIMGWANMHGNFGAAVAAPIYDRILGETPTLSQWNTLFAFCAGVFALAGVSAMVLDATKPITARRHDRI